MSGRLIVFEGIDGAGKATQVELVEQWSRKRATLPFSPRRSHETPTGKVVKAALAGAYGNFLALSPYLSALPYLLDFAAERDELTAALKKGIVISDRYISSTLAYHRAKLPGFAAQKFFWVSSRVSCTKVKTSTPNVSHLSLHAC